MGIILNRRRACGGKSLPYDYEVEYLESTGTQYIDTGYYPNTNTVIKTKALTKTVGWWLCNARWTGEPTYDTFGILLSNQKNIYVFYFGHYPDNKYYFFRNINMNVVNTLELGIDFVKVNQTSVAISRDSFSSEVSFYLFGANERGTPMLASNRIYYFKIYNVNDILFDFIPVVRNGVGYMYDKVSGTLFGNAGTGNFIVGPRVS